MHTRGFYPEVIIESEVAVRPRLITPHGDLDYFVYHKKDSNSCLMLDILLKIIMNNTFLYAY